MNNKFPLHRYSKTQSLFIVSMILGVLASFVPVKLILNVKILTIIFLVSSLILSMIYALLLDFFVVRFVLVRLQDDPLKTCLVWFYGPIFALSILALRYKSPLYFLVLSPSLFSGIPMAFLGGWPAFRYVYPSYLVGILLLGLMFVGKPVNVKTSIIDDQTGNNIVRMAKVSGDTNRIEKGA